MSFEITMVDATIETIDGADAYELEGPMTTFFLSNGRHQCLSSFSMRVASYRTDRVARIRRLEVATAGPRAWLEVV
jgi:hypothetical protein